MRVTIVTFRDIFQSEVQEVDRFGEDYRRMSAVVFLDKSDAAKAGIKDGSNVLVESDNGRVVVVARISDDAHPGLAFMPNSPWSNRLVPAETDDTRIPSYKSISATVSVTDDKVPTVEDLLRELVS
ncbi:MAG: formylmethanofuran dehydrogenase [Methanothrix sp.]|jgi:formylmethanofuran dehydrogenase subunit D|uniref:Formylmethanofuran dehydrogenase, subunit D n=1 Tax=Methanothrix thermoacetophila (strain DSM 6194 / JCM 14653 / NBRC 101360 / PT) TaxID=349307 RepID=A0B7T7_METTP|nr:MULTISPECIES: molybdopterin dinucleotide binding domain-containing protein [Methanothrix]ABK14761.1 formylmethanofuran dehydrogenase, subunit D [Methanothrix thermoacetophila PT]MBC7080406.1 formylmethanofuran dehydrogenase [Methanothrix sp.]NPU86926.1 formylmethanofuran dehydrogenase [Methanothrix sp.]